MAVVAIVAFDSLWATLLGGLVAALSACRLFIIAHDFIARQRNRPSHAWFRSLRKHWTVMRRCALFDYEGGRWRAFPKSCRRA